MMLLRLRGSCRGQAVTEGAKPHPSGFAGHPPRTRGGITHPPHHIPPEISIATPPPTKATARVIAETEVITGTPRM